MGLFLPTRATATASMVLAILLFPRSFQRKLESRGQQAPGFQRALE
tara:strand:- start:6657 stop:6794 length:138 start_codon:yes stop_codon:yes gene_type:complete